MSEFMSRMIDYVPFLGMAVGNHTLGSTPIFTRLAEAAIIGGVIMFGTVKVLGNDIEYIKQEIQSIKLEQQQVRRDLYRPRVP